MNDRSYEVLDIYGIDDSSCHIETPHKTIALKYDDTTIDGVVYHGDEFIEKFSPSKPKPPILILLDWQSNMSVLWTDYHTLPFYLQWKITGCKVRTPSWYQRLEAWVNCNPFDTSPWVNQNNFGVMLELWRRLYYATNREIYFCQVSWWATALYPWATVPDRYPTTPWWLYTQAVQHFQDAMAALALIRPNYECKVHYRYQCESDAVNSTYANAYLANSRFFIQSLRTDLWLPNLVDIYARIHPDEILSWLFPETATISAAQTTMATDPNEDMIPTDSLALRNNERIHLTSQSVYDLSIMLFDRVMLYI